MHNFIACAAPASAKTNVPFPMLDKCSLKYNINKIINNSNSIPQQIHLSLGSKVLNFIFLINDFCSFL